MDFKTANFELHKGKNKKHRILFFGLSTCGFCKKALQFLNDNSLQYHYIYLDRVPADEKTRIKELYKKEFGTGLLYPTVVIDNKEILNGFIRPSWEKALLT